MRNFYLSCKFYTLTINLSEVVLPGHIPLLIIVFGKERLRHVLNASQRRVNKSSLTWWYVFKMSWSYLCKTSWRRHEDNLKTFFKTSWRRLQNVLKTSWRCLQNVFKTSWRCLEDVFARRLEDAVNTYG